MLHQPLVPLAAPLELQHQQPAVQRRPQQQQQQQQQQQHQQQRVLAAYPPPSSSSSSHYLPLLSYHSQYPSSPELSSSPPDRFSHPAACEQQQQQLGFDGAEEHSAAFDAFDFLPEPHPYQHQPQQQQPQSQPQYPPQPHPRSRPHPAAPPHRQHAAAVIDSSLMLEAGVDEDDDMRLVMPSHGDRLYDGGLMMDESYAASDAFSPSFSPSFPPSFSSPHEPLEYELPGLSQHDYEQLPQHHQHHRQHQHQHQTLFSGLDHHYCPLESQEQPVSPHHQQLHVRRPVLATPAREVQRVLVPPVVSLRPVPPRHHPHASQQRQQQPHPAAAHLAASPASADSSWRKAAPAIGCAALPHPLPQPQLVRRTSLPSSVSLSALPVIASSAQPVQPQTASPPRIARPYATSPYATSSSSSSSPRLGSMSGAASVACSTVSRSSSGSCVVSPRSHSGGSVSQPTSPDSRGHSPPSVRTSNRSTPVLSPALALPHAPVVTPATTLTRTPSASAVATAAATVTPAISLHSLPRTPRASSAITPGTAVAATTVRSAPAVSAVMPVACQARPCVLSSPPSASRSSLRAQAAIAATVVTQVPALALTVQSREQMEAPASAGGKKRRRRATSQQQPAGYRGSATDTHAGSQQKRFTYEALVASPLPSTPARVAEAATVLPTSPLTISAPFARRRFSTVSTTSSSISGTSDDSGTSPASCYQPRLSTEDSLRLTAPDCSSDNKALRSHAICAMEATQAVDLTPKRRRSCANYSPSSSPPPPPHVVTVPLPALTRLVKLADPLSRAMVVRGVEHLFSSDHDKQAEGNVPSPSQVSTGSEGSSGSDAASTLGMGWEDRLAGHVRDHLRVRFSTPEARAVLDAVVPHVLFIHERGWQDYADCWEKEGGGGGGGGVKSLSEVSSMQRVSSDIAGTISALTLE